MSRLTDPLIFLRRGRHGVGPGDVAVPYMRSYVRSQRLMLTVFLILCAVEDVATELLVPWGWLRETFVVVGTLWMIPLVGLWAGFAVRPHVIGRDRVILRAGSMGAVAIPRSVIAAAEPRQSAPAGKYVRVAGRRLIVSIERTNVELRLREPYEVRLPRGTALVTSVSFRADDPRTALQALTSR